MPTAPLIACPDCDLLQRETPLAAGDKACCARCGVVLYRQAGAGSDATLALAIAAFALFVIANTLSIASLEVQAQHTETTLFGAIMALYDQDKAAVAALVFGTTMLAPALELCALLYMLLPLRWGRVPPHFARAFRIAFAARGWGLVDVFMLGVLVSLVKLGRLATVLPGIALWSFAGLVLLLAAVGTMFDPRAIWQQAEASLAAGRAAAAAAPLATESRA